MMRFLSLEQMQKLTTKRLLAYKNSLMRFVDGPNWDEDCIGKHSDEWKEAYQNIKQVLNQREHIDRKGKRVKLKPPTTKPIDHQEVMKALGAEPVTRPKIVLDKEELIRISERHNCLRILENSGAFEAAKLLKDLIIGSGHKL